MPSVATESTTKSGIITSDTGERHIPSSLRSDGTKRKEIRIRPGYKPPEDVEVYKNRTADAWKTRGTSGVPGLDKEDVNSDCKTSSNKNAKRREARKKAKASEEGVPEGGTAEQHANGAETEKSSTDTKLNLRPSVAVAKSEPNSDAEKEKLARNLKKKLRHARELREKKDKGDSLLPEQFEKVIKINELIRQLENLGFDPDGERKQN
ncbi:hypothetical protein MMC19_000236 [Ptychographa xylographoides]|nr:hypothetical protein [Ptychographa xylographoides]